MAANFDLSSEIETTAEKMKHARLCRLLIDGGKKALKNVFDRIHPPQNLSNVLSNWKIHLNHLKPITIKKTQWNILYPKSGTVNSENFDITLLTVLLRNICNLKPPSDNVWSSPKPNDRSIEADITRIRLSRNKLCHSSSTSMDDSDFKSNWSTLRDVLVRLGAKGDDIDKLETISMDSELQQQYVDDLGEWKRKEEEAEDLIQSMLKTIDIKEVNKIYCDDHEDDHLNMFCAYCLKPICSACTQIQHKQHEIVDVSNAAQMWRDIISEGITQVKNLSAEIQDSLKSAEESSQLLTQDFEAKTEQICCLVTVLDKQKEIERKLSQYHDKVKKDIDDEVKELEENADVVHNTLQFFEHVSRVESDIKLLQESKTIKAYLDKLNKLKTEFDHWYIDSLPVEVRDKDGKFDVFYQPLPELSYVGEPNIISSRYTPNDFSSSWHSPQHQSIIKYDKLDHTIEIKNYNGHHVFDCEALEATLTDSDGEIHHLEVIQEEEEERPYLYKVSFEVMKTGLHEVSVKLDNEDIDGSPMSVEVFPCFEESLIDHKDERLKYLMLEDIPSIAVDRHGKVAVITWTENTRQNRYHENPKRCDLHLFDNDFSKEKSVEIFLKCKLCCPKQVVASMKNTYLMTGCATHPVCEYDLDGNCINVIGKDTLKQAQSLALNTKTNTLYVTEEGTRKVYIFRYTDGEYEYIKNFQPTPGTFDENQTICTFHYERICTCYYLRVQINSQGHVLLNECNTRSRDAKPVIDVWSEDGENHIESIDIPECKDLLFTLDKDDNIYLLSRYLGNDCVQQLSQSGEFLRTIPYIEHTSLYKATGFVVIKNTSPIILVLEEKIRCFKEV